MKIRNTIATIAGALALTLTAGTAAQANTILNYQFDPGTTFDFGGGNTYLATGTFSYDATTQTVFNVAYTAIQTGTGPVGPFVFTAATTNSPTDVTFTGDAFGDEDEFFFANSLALGGTDAIVGFAYFGTQMQVTGSVTAGSVPEPLTWAMLVVGFGGIGATLRSRRNPLNAVTSF